MNTAEFVSSLKDINIVDLILDTENYRIGPQAGQYEAIQAMIEEQGEKLVEIAEDILDIGTSPIEVIVVAPDLSGKFRVLEGNRRVTALKLLHEPSLATGTSVSKKINLLSAQHAKNPVRSLVCKQMDNKQEAFPWIRRKHDNGFGGAATVPWSAIQIRRANEAEGNRQVTLEVLELVSNNGNLTVSDHQKLKKLPVTNLERILEAPSTLSLLGIDSRGNELVCQFDKDWTVNVLTDIVLDIAHKKIKVKDIYDEAKRKSYIQGIVNKQAQAAKKVKEWAIKKGGKIGAPATNGKVKRAIRTVPLQRKYLIPMACQLVINHPRLNAIYNELRRRIVLDSMPNAVSVMFRVFVEMSCDHYMAKNAITLKPGTKETLYNKLKSVADFMEAGGVMKKGELKPVRMAASSPNEILSTETLNSYVHNRHVIPKPQELRDSWDSIELFVMKLWN